ncbi:Sporulation initiation inhibitor protein soj [Kytococcus sedentarius]|nr:Sporulation initiation inhibitor protein soj [Kytococcus sedentarius]
MVRFTPRDGGAGRGRCRVAPVGQERTYTVSDRSDTRDHAMATQPSLADFDVPSAEPRGRSEAAPAAPLRLDDFPAPAPLQQHGPARVIALCNQKGGVGKTTTTINLGAALAELGRRVLLVDFDPQGALTVGTGVRTGEGDRTIYDLLMAPARELDVREVVRTTATPGLDVLPADIDLSAAEVQLVNEVAREQALARVLRPVLDDYDVVLIDCQPSLGLLTVNALTAAHGVIIPLETEYFALRGVALLVETIEKITDRLNPVLQIDGILPTMVDGRTLHSREVVASVTEHFGELVFTTPIRRTVKFPDATLAAEPITTYAPTHAGADAYRRLARELVARGGVA